MLTNAWEDSNSTTVIWNKYIYLQFKNLKIICEKKMGPKQK